MSKSADEQGRLYVVATPIGNLEDITTRARRILSSVSYIAAEDTRHTGSLLQHLGVDTPTRSYHDHNEAQVTQKIIADIRKGADIAIVSDAGTPQISDPGFRLVEQAFAGGIEVIPVPGASALSAALSVSGVATSRFVFEGFLPSKKGQRLKALHLIANEPRSMVFYEAPHRILRMLEDMVETLGSDRKITIFRELTKIHEQIFLGSIGAATQALEDGSIPSKGEFVVIVEGNQKEGALADMESEHVMRELIRELPASKAAEIGARLTGEPRKRLYQVALRLKNKL
ncbi:MAG TPA: 16S rRNA (cytidine(1402)-2'-O)-methyltransferase [Gammaproteobacteria bacterium]|nr:16S rRNA (cytidine(1402)-2'-O)-methyltransferase [Gammaproteobacteria bacterium]